MTLQASICPQVVPHRHCHACHGRLSDKPTQRVLSQSLGPKTPGRSRSPRLWALGLLDGDGLGRGQADCGGISSRADALSGAGLPADSGA
jgi:hypothetical protein